MPIRKTEKLKEMVYNALVNDADLVALLGGDKTKIRHSNPEVNLNYPCVTYNILDEQDDPYSEDRSAGIAKSMFEIQIFSTDSSDKEADAIESQIYKVLHGNSNLTSNDVRVFSIYRESRLYLFEPEVKVHRIVTNYKVTNALKV